MALYVGAFHWRAVMRGYALCVILVLLYAVMRSMALRSLSHFKFCSKCLTYNVWCIFKKLAYTQIFYYNFTLLTTQLSYNILVYNMVGRLISVAAII